MYYMRTRDGLEIDLLIEFGGKLYLFEIKSSMTVTPKFAEPLRRALADLRTRARQATLVSRCNDMFSLGPKILHRSWQGVLAT